MSHTELCRAKPAGRYVEFEGPSPPHANSKEAPWVWFEDDDVDDWTTSLEDKLASPISMCEGGNKEMQRMWDAGHRNRSRQTICYKMCKRNRQFVTKCVKEMNVWQTPRFWNNGMRYLQAESPTLPTNASRYRAGDSAARRRLESSSSWAPDKQIKRRRHRYNLSHFLLLLLLPGLYLRRSKSDKKSNREDGNTHGK